MENISVKPKNVWIGLQKKHHIVTIIGIRALFLALNSKYTVIYGVMNPF